MYFSVASFSQCNTRHLAYDYATSIPADRKKADGHHCNTKSRDAPRATLVYAGPVPIISQHDEGASNVAQIT